MNHTVPQRRGDGQIPGPPIPAPPGAGPPLPDLLPAGTCEVVATGATRPDPGPVTQPEGGRCPLSCGSSTNRLPELIVAAVAPDSHMSRPRPAASRIRLAQARRPAHLRRAGPLHPRTGALRLVFEQGSGYLNDQALTSRNESMITATHAVAAPQTSLRYSSRPRRSVHSVPPGSRPAKS